MNELTNPLKFLSGNEDYFNDLPYRVTACPRWIRVKFNGKFIADSQRALLLRQYGPNRLPAYYFPFEDVDMDWLEPLADTSSPDSAWYWNLRVGNQIAERAAWTFDNPSPEHTALKGYITFDWHKMEGWYEEEEEIFEHAPDPYHRVDVRASSRHIRIAIAGETVAETHRPYLLFETYLPARYYIPWEDVRMNLLEPTSLKTRCPYKGVASYWSVRIGDQLAKNIVWSYPEPIPECPKIKDLLCFFNEKVDVYINGILQERPQSPWS